MAQVAAHDLEIAADPVTELITAQFVGHGALAIDEQGAAHPRARLDDGIVRSHPAQYVECSPPNVDLVSAGNQRSGSLDDGRMEAELAQPVRRWQPSNARSGDQNVHLASQ